MKIGFIGLGIMGKPMANNIIKKGPGGLLVSSRNRDSVDELADCGTIAQYYEYLIGIRLGR